LLKILGARLVLTEGAKGMKGAIAKAEELASKIPNAVILQQFPTRESRDSPPDHREEIWRDTDGKVDIIVSGIGTGGTITAWRSAEAAQTLAEDDRRRTRCLADPVGWSARPHKLQGIGAGFVPAILNTKIYDEVIRVKETDAGPVSKQVNQLDGIPVGISSGAAVWARSSSQSGRKQGQANRRYHPVEQRTLFVDLALCRRNTESDSIDDLLPVAVTV